MKQLTIRGLSPDLEGRIRLLARQEGISLNQAVLRLLNRGAGLASAGDGPSNVVGDSLDYLFGTWSAEEERQFNDSIEIFNVVDESLWH